VDAGLPLPFAIGHHPPCTSEARVSGRRSNIRIPYFMNKKYLIGNGILWAAAIIASALVHAPVILSSIILPALAVCSVVVIRPKSKDSD